MRWDFILAGMLLLLAACAAVEEQPEENKTHVRYYPGDEVEFNFLSRNISVNGSIVIESTNHTGDVYLYEYCGIPLGVLKKEGNRFVWIFPDYQECADPVNATFSQNMTVDLDEIRPYLRPDENMGKGTYRIKLIYSTFAPDEYMRESNNILHIS